MQFSTGFCGWAIVATTLASALPAAVSEDKHACAYPTFKLVNTLYGDWASGKYASQAGDEFEFNTNDSSTAQVYTLNTNNGHLYGGDSNSIAYYLGLVTGHDAVVRFQSSSFIAGTDGATYVTCKTPTANGDALVCDGGDGSGKYERFNMCWGNSGGQGLGLVVGNGTGPYLSPYYIKNWLFCGGVKATVADLGCGSAPA